MSLSFSTMSAIRFGYGIRPGEKPVENSAALMAQLERGVAETPLYPTEGIQERHQTIREILLSLRDVAKARKNGGREEARNLRKPVQRRSYAALSADEHARFQQAVYSPNGFYERLVVFWSNHFSVSTRKRLAIRLYVPLLEAAAIRPNVAGKFNTLLKAAVINPAMLIYLDQIRSVGPNSAAAQESTRGLNENLGRELLELHTLGADGGYSQDDVRAASMVLTGLGVKPRTTEVQFRRRIAEPGPHVVMGMSFGGRRRGLQDVEDMLDALAGMEQTARHICRKLVIHFISDDPPEDVVTAMTSAWADSDGDLSAVYRAMLDHPQSWENGLAKARQPFDYIVAGLRAVNVPVSALAVPGKGDDGDPGDDIDSVEAMAAPAPADMAMGKPADMDDDMADGSEDEAAMKQMTPAKKDRKKPGKKLRLGNPLSAGAAMSMGQAIWQPASPAGWEEAFDVWVSSSQLTERITWARRLADRFGNKTDPRDLVKVVLADAARADTIQIVNQAASAQAGTIYILASPEFNRR